MLGIQHQKINNLLGPFFQVKPTEGNKCICTEYYHVKNKCYSISVAKDLITVLMAKHSFAASQRLLL